MIFRNTGSLTRRQLSRRLGMTAAVAASAVGLAACGSATGASGVSSGSITIGVNLPLTGAVAGQAQQLLAGYQFGISQVNAKGGVGGKKIHLVVKDDQFNPSTAATAVKQMIVQDNVDALLGSFGSPVGIAASAVAEQYKVPVLQTFVSDPSLVSHGYKYTFNLFPLASQIEPTTDQFITGQLKAKRVALIYLNLGWAQAGDATSVKELEAAGTQVVANEQVATGQSDYTSALSKIRAAHPQAVKMILYDGDVVTVLQQMRELGIKPEMVYVEGDPFDNPDVTQALGAHEALVTGTPTWYPAESAFPAANAVAMKYQKSSHKQASAEMIKGYQAVQVLVNALKRANSTDPGKIRAALATTNMSTILGPVRFDANGQVASNDTVLVQYQNGMKLVTLWPAKFKDGSYLAFNK